jgi:tripartite ATP-independent transporter DctP family solute receptor
MKRFHGIKCVVFAIAFLFLSALIANAAPVILKAEHDEPAGSITDRILNDMAKKVPQITNGRVEMQVFPGCQLSGGKIKTMIQNTSLGSTHLAFTSAATFTAWDINIAVCNLPFLVENYDAYEKLRKVKPMVELLGKWEKIGIKGIDYWSRCLRQFVNTKRPITTPNDMKGMRFRVMETPLMVSIFKSLGAHPIGMPFGEIFSALQLGTIDGAERPTEFLLTEKWWDLAKYVTMSDYTGDLLIVQANLKFFKNLEKKDQENLIKFIKEGGDKKYRAEKAMQEKAVGTLKEKGMTVSFLTKEQANLFREKTKPVWGEYEPKFDKGLIDRVVKGLKE